MNTQVITPEWVIKIGEQVLSDLFSYFITVFSNGESTGREMQKPNMGVVSEICSL